MGPLTPDQRTALLSGIQMVSAAGYRMSFTIVDDNGLAALILARMPDAIIIYRFVAGDHDPNPHLDNCQYQTGAFWFDFIWPHDQVREATYHQFVNEWEGNFDSLGCYTGYGQFYIQLGAYARPRGVVATYGDFSVGTPPDANNKASGEQARFMELTAMFRDAVANGNPINVHLYSPEGAGAWDMKPGKDYYTMRWEQIASRYPQARIIAGEGGNFGDGGRTFDPDKTPFCMKQMAGLLRASPFFSQFLGLHWWGVVDGNSHRDWAKDDITPILPWFFQWSITGQPV